MSKGDKITIDNIDIFLEDAVLKNKSNFQELRVKFSIQKNNLEIAKIYAGKNYYFVSKIITTEAGIFHDWLRDVYIVVGDQNNENFQLKIYINPLVSFIWLGIMIIVISGIIGIIKK